MKRPATERGIALVLVLWLVVLLTVIGASHAYNSRVETRVTLNQVDALRARALAEAGINRGIMELFSPDPSQRWRFDGREYELVFETGVVRVALRNAAGRVDLNMASEELLDALLNAVIDDAARAEALRDAILDWRDPDNLVRLNGAEDREYQAAGRSYKPRNGPFDRVDELLNVLGMDDGLYRRLEPYLTVKSGQTTVNPRFASRSLLAYLTQAEPAALDEYLARRAETDPGEGVWPAGAGLLGSGESRTHYIGAVGNGPAGARVRIEALVSTPGQPYAYTVHAWHKKPFEPAGADSYSGGYE